MEEEEIEGCGHIVRLAIDTEIWKGVDS